MTATLIDTHAHLTDKSLIVDLDGVISRAKHNGVAAIICVGTNPRDCRAVCKVARCLDFVFAAGGISPHDAKDYADIGGLRDALVGEKLVAIGETGLDYYYHDDEADRARQRDIFGQHLDLAAELGLPVIVHCRDAVDDTLAIIKSADRNLRGVFHCFTGTGAEARLIVDLGWYVSFAGILTFKKSDELRRIAADLPAQRILVETDSPYLTPEPVRRRRPNEPTNVRYVAAKLAEVRDTDLEKTLAQLWANTIELFGPIIERADIVKE